MNAHRSHNEYDSISGSPNINVINEGSNRQASATANRPEQIGGQNENNREDMSQTSYDNFGNIINWLTKGLAKVTTKELIMAWDE